MLGGTGRGCARARRASSPSPSVPATEAASTCRRVNVWLGDMNLPRNWFLYESRFTKI